MERDYSELLEYAAGLQAYDGYLDTDGLKQRQAIEAKFATVRNKFVYALLRDGGDWQDISRAVSDDLDQIETASDPSWQAPIALVRENLLTRIEKEGRKKPWLRTAVRWTPAALAVAVAIAFFGIRFASAVDISQSLETRVGLEQRAAATKKVIRYDDWMSSRVRRGGWLKGILLWPIEPSETEIQGAQEFVALTLDGYAALSGEGEICGVLPQGAGDSLSEQQLDLIGDVATFLRDTGTQWEEPPIMTVLEPIRRAFPC